MECLRCKVEMVSGIAIDPKGSDPIESFSWGNPTLKAKDIEIKECLKCPLCGHSEDNGSGVFHSYYR